MGNEDAVYLAKLAEQAERYEGTLQYWEYWTSLSFSREERRTRLMQFLTDRDGGEHEDRRLGGPRPHG